ncbi:NAD-dependent epimerase/dehydratase family protein [Sphingobium aquiterrae]|uniref:NAD-dependent epimerase/dehydratase family protein n=1 Tax=Sphingobium aquiterrae TaxID=2038656 RepID=UPI003017BA22
MKGFRLAITGATGFVGAATLDRALKAGFSVNALTRGKQPSRRGVTWVAGALDDQASLDRLVRTADAVLHIAGVINAPDRAGFEEGNALGTMRVVDAARKAGVRRFVHVSSLAAREPALSAYGWSKELAERYVKASALDWTIVRPPAVYGPGDREMLELFRMAKRGFMLLPPAGKLSIIEVGDLADLLLALILDRHDSHAELYEVDDGTKDGLSYDAFGRAIGRAVGKHVRCIASPRWLLDTAAWLDGTIRRDRAKLTPDRVNYYCHPDWVSDPRKAVPPHLWSSKVFAAEGLAETARAYRAKGWL